MTEPTRTEPEEETGALAEDGSGGGSEAPPGAGADRPLNGAPDAAPGAPPETLAADTRLYDAGGALIGE